ncbi:MAG: hypothetical protein HYY78_17530 [Betaproteobacteria bacterium]|nr:hypothetical protein [Betaproteobacteria bacterium]
MRTKTDQRRGHEADEPAAFILDDELEAPCSEYLVMSQERDLPALAEYLHELRESGSRTIH